MIRNMKRIIAAFLASVLLFTDCASGFAAETNTEQSETEILEGNLESNLTEEMQEEFLQDTSTNEDTAQVLFEMEELREQSAKQFRLSDGSILAAQYGMDVHYEAEDGEWKEIDNRFLYEAAENEEDFAGYKSAEGAVEFKFAPQVQEGELVKITHEDYEVGFELLPPVEENDSELEMTTAMEKVEEAEKTEELKIMQEVIESEEDITELAPASISFLQGELLNPEEVPAELVETPALMRMQDEKEVIWADVSPGTPAEEEVQLFEDMKVEEAVTSVGYGNVLPGVSLQYVLSGSSLKEYILVNEKADSYSYDFAMNLENLEPQMQEDGSIILRDVGSETAVYKIPAGYMTDATGEVSDAVTMNVTEKEDDSWILNLTADENWINAEERVFPVQIDPTLMSLLESQNEICGTYVEQVDSDGEANIQYGNMMVGYDSQHTKINRAYIQLRNLPEIPKESVICGAVTYFYVMDQFSHVGHSVLDIAARKVTETTAWRQRFFWNTQPDTDPRIMDYRAVSEAEESTYVGWNITELVKEHYGSGNTSGSVSAFMLSAYDEKEMKNSYCAKAVLRLTESNVYPLLQIMYRDTKGIEDYYTYQVHDGRNAGTVYLEDYNGQITIVKPAVSYESTIMPYGLDLVYNSSHADSNFTKTANIHTKDFSNMKIGHGWKLSAQETVTEVQLETVEVQNGSPVEVQTNWLIYNDGDGTEHYFKKAENSTTKYEDEDGLNLTIEKNGSNYTMTDKNGNSKYFSNGYLTKITDADLNEIHIIYNNGSIGNNVPKTDGTNQITAVYSKPYDSNVAAQEKIFALTYNNGYLTKIEESYSKGNDASPNYIEIGYETKNSKQYLKRIWLYLKGEDKTEIARYGNTGIDNKISHVLDVETNRGIFYLYTATATGSRVSYFRDYAQNDGGSNGREVTVENNELRKTIYTDSGADRSFGTADDIITTYQFNSYGQTANANSRDKAGALLGVTASSYMEKQETNKTNNRLLKNISTGQMGVSLLINGSFENYTGIPTDTTTESKASNWTHSTYGKGKISCRADAPYSGEIQYNIYNSQTSGEQKIFQTVSLKAGVTYTASAYVNTERAQSFGTDGGAYMMMASTSGTPLKTGIKICHKTTEHISEGWQRISVTYTPASNMDVRVCIVWGNAKGTLRVDDVQLETGDAPSNFNYVNNGGFEQGEAGWEVKKLELTDLEKAEEAESGKPTTICGTGSFLTKSQPGNYYSAEQSIPLNKSSNTTFLLSGWSRGNSVPDLTKGSLLQTDRLWGVYVKFIYEDGYNEDRHYVQFDEYAEDWQYAALTVVPKHKNNTILEAQVRVYYFNNANWAYFDNISLTEEPAQTYIYDDDGNLTSVESTGNGNEIYEYDTQNLQNLERYTSEGNGIYDYEYSTGKNKHQLVKVTNDNVSLTIGYDNCGEALSTTITGAGGMAMKSGAVYSKGLLTEQTDNTGAKTTYTYNQSRDCTAVKYANNQEIKTKKENVWGHIGSTWQSGYTSVNYEYLDGSLDSLTRVGYLDLEKSDDKQYKQTYGFEYDMFGNREEVTLHGEVINRSSGAVESSGDSMLVSYNYKPNNGPLESMTYAPGTDKAVVVNYTYDKLERVASVNYDDTDTTYGYHYSSDGSLAGITVNGAPAYDYTYDSLGRLIYSAKLQDKRPVLYTSHQYDTSNRLTEQNWQIGSDSFSESYTYNENDGTLISMTSGGDALGFAYNNLKQLSGRTSPKLDMTYTYRKWTDAQNKQWQTNQVASVQYMEHGTDDLLLPTLNYSYDSVGNIAQIKENSSNAAQYSYDAQNQVTKEILPSQTSDYTYDTYGNIRSKKTNYSNGTYEQYTYTYGNAAWKDQMTAVSYRDTGGTIHNGTFEYDAVGNPTVYNKGQKKWTFEWKQGRQLAMAVGGNQIITFAYDVDGIRERKSVQTIKSVDDKPTIQTVIHDYTTLGGKIVREAYDSTIIDYFYDNDGRPYKIIVKVGSASPVTGYFVLNLQGDVIAIIDEAGTVAVKYQYDAWGKEISHTTAGDYGSTLYNHNALKYRGYYYDAETGFYYVSSRYYDPEIGRFINADTIDLVLTSQTTLTDKNLYAYCDNNPVMRIDMEGQCWATIGIIAAGGVVGALLGAFSAAATKGNVIEGAIEGALTGVIGSACGLLSIHPLGAVALASLGGSVVDLGMQLSIQYIENSCVDFSKIDERSIVKTGVMTGLGTAIPVFGAGAQNTIDAVGTALIWAEGATLITCADIILTNNTSSTSVKAVGMSSSKTQNSGKGTSRITKTMTTADYFRQKYNAS